MKEVEKEVEVEKTTYEIIDNGGDLIGVVRTCTLLGWKQYCTVGCKIYRVVPYGQVYVPLINLKNKMG